MTFYHVGEVNFYCINKTRIPIAVGTSKNGQNISHKNQELYMDRELSMTPLSVPLFVVLVVVVVSEVLILILCFSSQCLLE